MPEVKKAKKISRQRRYQLRMIRSGRCQSCGKPRGKSGSRLRCDECNAKYRKPKVAAEAAE